MQANAVKTLLVERYIDCSQTLFTVQADTLWTVDDVTVKNPLKRPRGVSLQLLRGLSEVSLTWKDPSEAGACKHP